MMEWSLMQWLPSPCKPTAAEGTKTFILLLPLLASLLYRLYAKIRRRDGRSVGLQILSDAPNNDHVKYEIIAVHGLGANPEHTWTYKSRSKSKRADTRPCTHLLRDLLMKDERFSDARILHFAYNSDWLVDACFESARDIGRRLMESLIEHRKSHPRLPLIFVGHSFGGIVIKEALSSDPEDTQRILEDTCGIIFLGTPHLGSPVAGFGATIAYLTGFLGSNTGLLLLLRSNGEMLVNLSIAFQACLERKHQDLDKTTRIVSICEQKPTYLLNWLYAGMIVPLQSATFGTNFMEIFTVDKDHSGLNKCPNSKDALYKQLTAQLHKMLPTTPPKINKLQQDVIDRLMPVTAADAEFHPGLDEYRRGYSECLPQTRERILNDICDWLDGSTPSQKHLYWLQGKAGTGKSTIARTIVGRMTKENRVVASFFFKRGEGDRSRLKRFFTTLAIQLVRKLPSLAEAVQDALESDPSLPEQDPRIQFKKLIQEPLEKQKLNRSKAIVVVVVDALDECDAKEDLTTLVQQLTPPILSVGGPPTSGQLLVKYFLTSRLDYHTVSDFNKITQEKCEKRELEKAASEMTQQDIERYLQFHLQNIDGLLDPTLNDDPWSNPSDLSALKKLTERACPLFEYAAASCRYIAQDTIPGSPRDRLDDLLQLNVYGDLDGIYLPILNRRFFNLKGQSRNRAKAQFQSIIGSVVSLADSVTVGCLVQFLGQPERAIRNELRLFESVLVIPTEQDGESFVKLFHESFRDFLAGPEANEEFKLDTHKIHFHLAERCLQLLSGALKENVCNLKSPGTQRNEIAEGTIQRFLPPEIQYACRFWIFHVRRTEFKIRDDDGYHSFLTSHLLHWLEALSLLGRTSESALLVKELQVAVHSTEGAKVRSFLEDVERIILSFRHIIDAAPLQLYSSVLTFSPMKSLVRANFDRCRAKWINRTPNIRSQWSRCLQTLEGHDDPPTCVAFSSNNILASTDMLNRIKVWDHASGTCLQSFSLFHDVRKNSDGVNTFHFSLPDGLLLGTTVSYSHGTLAYRKTPTIAVWDTQQNRCLQLIYYEQHTGIEPEVYQTDPIFFLSGQKLPFSNGCLHKALNLEFLRERRGHLGVGIHDALMTLSFDGQYAASIVGQEIWIFDVSSTPKCLLKIPNGSVRLIIKSRWQACFSRDNQYFALKTGDLKIYIWDISSTTQLQVFKSADAVTALAFSQDNRFLAIGCYRGEIVIWDWEKSTRVQTLTGHQDGVCSLAFSPNGDWLASGSYDNTIKIWDTIIPDIEEEDVLCSNTGFLEVATDGQRLAMLSSVAETPQLFDDFGDKYIEQPFRKKYSTISLSANGNILAAAVKGESSVEIWDVDSGNYFPIHSSHCYHICSIALSANGKRFIIGFHSCKYEVRDSRTGQLVKEWQQVQGIAENGYTKTAISSDGEQVAWLRDTLKGAWIYTQNLSASTPQKFQFAFCYLDSMGLTFSQNGKLLAAVSSRWGLSIWDTTKGVCLRKFDMALTYSFLWNLNLNFINFDFDMTAHLSEKLSPDDCLTKYHISMDGDWIMRYSEKLLWILPEYRPKDAALSGSNIAIGRASGRPFVIGLSDDGLLTDS